jgi:hypothetical protein
VHVEEEVAAVHVEEVAAAVHAEEEEVKEGHDDNSWRMHPCQLVFCHKNHTPLKRMMLEVYEKTL